MTSFAELMAAIDQFDVEDYLSDKGFRALRPEEWVGTCPVCHKDDKLAVNVEKKTFHCWVCQEYESTWDAHSGMMRRKPVSGAGGLIKLIEWLEEVETSDAIQQILESFGHGDMSELPANLVQQVAEAADSGRAPTILPPEFATPIHSPLPYMLKRGITMDDVRTYGLFWCSDGRYRNRLVFPVWEDGHLVYWQARAMYEKHEVQHGKFIKALNPPSQPGGAVSSDVLMNLDLASRYPRVAIVEGPMDVIKTGPDAVCTFGKQLHPRQLQRLRSRGVTSVDLMWDGPTPTEPDGAHLEMLAIAPQLSSFFDTKLVFLPHGDPGDWDRESLWQFRAAGIPASYFAGRL